MYVCTSGLTRKRRIRTHNELKAQNLYTHAQAAWCSKVLQPTQSCIRSHKPINAQKPYNLRKAADIAQSLVQTCANAVQLTQIHIQLRTQTNIDIFEQNNKYILSIVSRSKKGKCTNKSRRINGKGTAIVTRGRWYERPVSAHRSIQLGFNSHQAKNPHLDHPKNHIDVLRARPAIALGLTGNNITTGPNQYRFTWILLDGEALIVFNLKPTELCHETVTKPSFSNESCRYLFWSKIVSLQAEALHLLQNGETLQAHHNKVCGIGLWYKFNDGTDATPIWWKPTTGLIWSGGFSR